MKYNKMRLNYISLLMTIVIDISYSSDDRSPKLVEDKCISCHQAQSIPSEMIYRRYLLKYSSKDTIRDKIYRYLRSPSTQDSIMPPQFFSKFPLKEPIEIDERELKGLIDRYIDYFDISHKLYIDRRDI